MRISRFFVFTLSLLLLISSSIIPVSAAELPTIWAVSGMERVSQDGLPGTSTQINLNAARGEYESFQVVVRAPSTGLTNVNFQVTDLTGANGSVISKSNFTLYREHYVKISQTSPDWQETNRPLPAGTYADALIPFVNPDTNLPLTGGTIQAVPFDLNAYKNQPIWVDIFVPRNTVAGTYQGQYTVTSAQGNVSGTIVLNVFNFELPKKPSLMSSFQAWDSTTKDSTIKELLRNKIMPTSKGSFSERSLIDTNGLNTLNLGYWSGADVSTGYMKPSPTVDTFKAAVATHEPETRLYNYTADEIGGFTSLFTTLKEWARNLHAAGVDNLVTMAPTADLLDDGSGTGRSAVDIWVTLPKQYYGNETIMNTARNKGDELWSYNCLTQDGYSPKWLITYDPINYRIQPGFINQSLGMNGILYWRVDLWTSSPWTDVNTYKSSSGLSVYPGEGMLVYPGQQVGLTNGVVPSMRLKWLREGIEDYEYVEILKKQGKGDAALQIVRSVGADWKTWTKDYKALESAKMQLAQMVNGQPPVQPVGPDFTVGTPVFTDYYGKTVTTLIRNGYLVTTVKVTNNTTETRNVKLTVRLYNSYNSLNKSVYTQSMINSGSTATLRTSMKLPKTISGYYAIGTVEDTTTGKVINTFRFP